MQRAGSLDCRWRRWIQNPQKILTPYIREGMVHETLDQEAFLREVASLLKPTGRILIAEPSFHVSKVSFEETTRKAEATGLSVVGNPRIFFSKTALLARN